jgi:hypothetical protein
VITATKINLDDLISFKDTPANNVLVAEKLTNKSTSKPEIINGFRDLEAVFNFYKPNVDVSFEDISGATRRENLRFKNLGSFNSKGITNQSPLLKDLNMKHELYIKIVKELKTNKVLKTALEAQDGKKDIISVLNSLITDIQKIK